MKAEDFGLLFLAAALGWWLHAPPPSGETHNSYLLFCDDKLVQGECPGNWHHKGIATYAAFPQQQIVIENYSPGGVYKFDHCAVVDAESWHCYEEGPLGRDLGCQNGECKDTDDHATDRRVGPLRYYIARFLDLFSPSRWG